MTGLKATALYLVLHLAVTFHLGAGFKLEFTINSTKAHVQDMTCSFDGSGAKSEIKGILQIDIFAILENSERRLATVSGVLPKLVTPGQDQLLQSVGDISGQEGVLRLTMKANQKDLKYACRVMVLDKNLRPITMEKLRKNNENLLLSMLNQRFAGISSGVDLHEAFQKLEDKVEDTQNFLTDKLEDTQDTLAQKMELKSKSIEDLSKGLIITEAILNDTEETVSEILDKVRSNEDSWRTNQIQMKSQTKKFDEFSAVLESLVEKMTNVKNAVEKVVDQRETWPMKSCDAFRNDQLQVSSSRVTIINSYGIPLMCDTETNGGGWTVFQRRIDGKVDFYRTWKEYEQGFGSMDSSFWMGLEHLSSLVAKGRWELRVELEYEGKMYHAEFSTFKIGNAFTNYKLNVAGYSGTAGDSLVGHHNGMAFSTYDMDHDSDSGNCAKVYHGAWWYRSCHYSNLNGLWGSKESSTGINWYEITGYEDSATFTEMKIRLIR